MFDYLQPRDGPVVDGLEAQEVVYAKDQPEYVPLRTLKSVGRMGAVITRWALTPEQRKAVAEGADIYLELSTFHAPLQPIRMAVSDGKLDPRWVKMCLLNQALTPDEIETLEIVVDADSADIYRALEGLDAVPGVTLGIDASGSQDSIAVAAVQREIEKASQ